jgi:uncharacterized SAM-binding protein YcdF (DUF218 family)
MMKKVCRIIRTFLAVSGSIFVVAVILAFTSAPFWMWYGLSVSTAGVNRPPDYIVVLGGGGMPSESGLMRCWYAAKTARYFSRARVIVALPGDARDSLSSVNGMKKELVVRGIAPERILLEDSGTNTRSEALNIVRLIPDFEHSMPGPGRGFSGKGPAGRQATTDRNSLTRAVLIVTSPEHLRRAVLTFRKAGFTRVDGIPAFEEAIESDITFTGRRLGGRKWVPDIGNSITLRYQFWTQLRYEELILREGFALTYYWLKGWI